MGGGGGGAQIKEKSRRGKKFGNLNEILKLKGTIKNILFSC